jgi:coenzyme PQQ precursor peptide PqqA
MKPPFEAVARLLRARVSPHHQRAGAVVGQQLEQHRVRDLAVEELNSSNWIRTPRCPEHIHPISGHQPTRRTCPLSAPDARGRSRFRYRRPRRGVFNDRALRLYRPHDFGRICRRVLILLGCLALEQHVHLRFRWHAVQKGLRLSCRDRARADAEPLTHRAWEDSQVRTPFENRTAQTRTATTMEPTSASQCPRASQCACAPNLTQCILCIGMRSTPMTWTTPILVEICIGLEINGYLPAEF